MALSQHNAKLPDREQTVKMAATPFQATPMSTTMDLLAHKLNLETARLPWHELERHFARGAAIAVAADLDLIATAQLMAQDDAAAIETLLQAGRISRVSDEQARQWAAQDSELWVVVVAPWVLVQAPTPFQAA